MDDPEPNQATPSRPEEIGPGAPVPGGRTQPVAGSQGSSGQQVPPEAHPTGASAPQPAPAAVHRSRLSPTRPRFRPVLDEPLDRNELLGWLIAAGLVTLGVAVILILSILGLINNGLAYLPSASYESLNREIQQLKTQTTTLNKEINNLHANMTTLESPGGKVGDLEKEIQDLRSEIEARDQKIADLSQQVQNLQARSQAFEKFLEGLRTLLGNTN